MIKAGILALYQEEDFYYYDRFRNGNPYSSTMYREHFRTILAGLSEKRFLKLSYKGKNQLLAAFKGSSGPFPVTPPRTTNSACSA